MYTMHIDHKNHSRDLSTRIIRSSRCCGDRVCVRRLSCALSAAWSLPAWPSYESQLVRAAFLEARLSWRALRRVCARRPSGRGGSRPQRAAAPAAAAAARKPRAPSPGASASTPGGASAAAGSSSSAAADKAAKPVQTLNFFHPLFFFFQTFKYFKLVLSSNYEECQLFLSFPEILVNFRQNLIKFRRKIKTHRKIANEKWRFIFIPAKLTVFRWNFEIWAVQKYRNLVDLEEPEKMSIWLLS